MLTFAYISLIIIAMINIIIGVLVLRAEDSIIVFPNKLFLIINTITNITAIIIVVILITKLL